MAIKKNVRLKKVNEQNLLVIQNAKLLPMPYRNFEGRPTKVNPQGGDRSFGVVIDDPEIAQQLAADGWNIKTRTSRDGSDGDDEHWLAVKIKYRRRDGSATIPPRIIIRTENNEVYYEEDNIKLLDGAELADVKLVINPSFWETSDKHGITAYLKSMSAVLIDDSFFFDDDDGDLPFDV